MNIIILGGTGFIGSLLSTYFRARGHIVTIGTRQASLYASQPTSAPHANPIKYVSTEESALSNALNGSTAVINLSGEPLSNQFWTHAKRKRILASRIESSRTLNRFLGTLAKPPKVAINASAIGIYAEHTHGVFSESSALPTTTTPPAPMATIAKTPQRPQRPPSTNTIKSTTTTKPSFKKPPTTTLTTTLTTTQAIPQTTATQIPAIKRTFLNDVCQAWEEAFYATPTTLPQPDSNRNNPNNPNSPNTSNNASNSTPQPPELPNASNASNIPNTSNISNTSNTSNIAAKNSPYGAPDTQSLSTTASYPSQLNQENCRKVCIRIPIVLAQSGGAFPMLRSFYQKGLGSVLGTGRQGFSWIHGTDLVRLIDFIIKTPRITGTLNACAPQPIEMRVFAKTLAQTLQTSLLPPIPKPVLRLSMGERSTLLTEGAFIIPQYILTQTTFHYLYPTIHQALADLSA